AVCELAGRLAPEAVVAAGDETRNELMAHVAARLDLPFAANCVSAAGRDPLSVTRVRWGGSLLEEARLHGPTKLLTLQPHPVAAATVAGSEPPVGRFSPP